MSDSRADRPTGWLGVAPRPADETQTATDDNLRRIETGPRQAESLGVSRPNLTVKPLDEETARGRWAEEEQRAFAAEQAAVTQDELAARESILTRWLGPLDAIGWCAVVIMGGLGALLVLSQGLAVLDMATRQPPAVAYPLIGLVVVLSTMVAVAIARLVIGYTRLRRSPRHSLQTLSELRFRAHVREEAGVKLAAARADLERFLRQFPLDKTQAATWSKLGLDGPELVRKLRNARASLIERSQYGTDLDWIQALDRSFLVPLDKAADSIIWRHTRQVGVRTAVVPLAFWDDAVLILALARMVRGLCLVYNVRTSAAGTVTLMGWSMAALAFATEVESLHGTIRTQIHDFLCNHLGHSAAQVVDTVAPSVAQGTANGFFTYRVGRAAVKHLRPLEAKSFVDA